MSKTSSVTTCRSGVGRPAYAVVAAGPRGWSAKRGRPAASWVNSRANSLSKSSTSSRLAVRPRVVAVLVVADRGERREPAGGEAVGPLRVVGARGPAQRRPALGRGSRPDRSCRSSGRRSPTARRPGRRRPARPPGRELPSRRGSGPARARSRRWWSWSSATASTATVRRRRSPTSALRKSGLEISRRSGARSAEPPSMVRVGSWSRCRSSPSPNEAVPVTGAPC